MRILRIVDSGLRPARANLSLTEALAAGLRADGGEATLRFQHFPPSAIVGRHQRLEREIDLGWAARNGVATARRMTGGGAIVMGPGILGWELVTDRRTLPQSLTDISALLCGAAADALRAMGAPAQFRPRNDVEVEGRKVCGTGGYFDGDVLIFQGTVLIELDRELMSNALRLPAHKLQRRGVASLFERVTDLAALLGAPPPVAELEAMLAGHVAGALGLEPVDGAVTPGEERRARRIHDDLIGTDAFVSGRDDAFAREGLTLSGAHETPFGTVEAVIRLADGAAGTVDQVLIAGDFFAASPRVILDLEAHLRGVGVDGVALQARRFLHAHDAGFLGMSAEDIVSALTVAAEMRAAP